MRPDHDGNGLSRKPAWLTSAGRGLLDAVFPPQALDRAGGRTQSGGLSPEAWSRLIFVSEPQCDGCGAPFEYEAYERCAACLARPRAFARARAALIYDEASRELILQFKHADRTDLAGLFCNWVSRAADDLLADAELVVPVPLHPSRLLSRRYNQAAEIARPLARRHGVSVIPDALFRSRPTGSQAGKSGSGRRRNVAGAFKARPGAIPRIEGRRILLIDDVMTTGATLEACAKALLAAGAGAVDAAVIAMVRETSSASI